MSRVVIMQGDWIERLRELPDRSVHCVVTSPPYWGLRDYGTAKWEGASTNCDHKQDKSNGIQSSTLQGGKASTNHQQEAHYTHICGKCGARRIDRQLGLEKTPEEYVAKMVAGFREVRRVLRDDGTLWLNVGDSYYNYRTGYNGALNKQSFHKGPNGKPVDHEQGIARRALKQDGLKEKDLCGIPWRVAFALQADGWYLRSDIIWHKPNPMPESVTDRPTKSHEYIFLLSKSQRYFYDAEAIKEQSITEDNRRPYTSEGAKQLDGRANWRSGEPRNGDAFTTRNKRSIWTVATAPYKEAHFATFPPDLIKPCILAGTSARGCCAKCGAPWERVVEKGESMWEERKRNGAPMRAGDIEGGRSLGSVEPSFSGATPAWKLEHPDKTTGWAPTCQCGADPIPCTILDPFGGSGTTGQVAIELGRRAILIELNPAYVKLAEKRTFITPGFQLA